ncbi:ankyrin repeat protein [Reticulomyxa filosa]|uniref:Ankyrin repeat protein n=1 Tax=Reticulomyxa filosa TaxID=46433 RepID=X6NYQ7_RETFI|nr:ankyrin repeat protein [Reticulomyxa filosa]|eukprot:ETO31023.1 ankyrin repeat protein [Reticulomyxa filosa]
MTNIPEALQSAILEDNILKARQCLFGVNKIKKELFLNEYWFPKSNAHAGQTFLHLCTSHNINIGKWLINEGAQPNVFDLQDNTPLHLACFQKRKAFIRLLMQANANPNLKNIENKLCYQMLENCDEQAQMKKCVDEMKILVNAYQAFKTKMSKQKDKTAAEIKCLLSKMSSSMPVKQLLQKINEHFVELLVETQTDAVKHNASGQDINKKIQEWDDAFSAIGIDNIDQLSLPQFENWTIDIKIPLQLIFIIEFLIDSSLQNEIEESEKWNNQTSIGELLNLAGSKLDSKYTNEELKNMEEYFNSVKVQHVEELLNISEQDWETWTEIPLDVKNVIKKMVQYFCVVHTCGNTAAASTDNHTNKESKVLLQCEAVISSVHIASSTQVRFVHVGTIKGKIFVWDLQLKECFHKFELNYESDNQSAKPVAPMWMDFIDNNKFDQLVIGDEHGVISCWSLHSQFPRLRAYCLQKWKTHERKISGLKIINNNRILSVGFDGYLIMRDLYSNGDIVIQLQITQDNALTCMKLLPSDVPSPTHVIVGSECGSVFVVPFNMKASVQVISCGYGPIRDICFDSKNNLCFVCAQIQSIRVLSTAGDTPQWTHVGTVITCFNSSTEIFNRIYIENENLWTCGDDGIIKIWDLKYLYEQVHLQLTKSKKKFETPKCLLLTVEDKQHGPQYLEAWRLLQIDGKTDSIIQNGIESIFLLNNESVVVHGYQHSLVAFDLQQINQQITENKPLIVNRRKQLLQNDKMLMEKQNENKDNEKKEPTKKKRKNNSPGTYATFFLLFQDC